MAIVTYRGANKTLVGEKFDVPDDIVRKGLAARWIEETVATAEQQKRLDLQVENERKTRRNQQDKVVGEIRAQLRELEANVTALADRMEADPPDMATAALAANQTAAAIDRHYRLSQEALELQDTIEEPLLEAGRLAEESKSYLLSAQQERDASIKIARNQQAAVNAQFDSYSKALQRARTDLNELNDLVGEFKSEVSANRETVRQASRIKESAVGIARDTASTAVEEMRDEFYGTLNLILQAVGLDRSAALQTLNSAAVKGPSGAILTRQELMYYTSLYRQASDTEAVLETAHQDGGIAGINSLRVD